MNDGKRMIGRNKNSQRECVGEGNVRRARKIHARHAANKEKQRDTLQLWCDLIQFGEKEFLAFDFATVFETNQVRFARRAGHAGDLIDEIPGGFFTAPSLASHLPRRKRPAVADS